MLSSIISSRSSLQQLSSPFFRPISASFILNSLCWINTSSSSPNLSMMNNNDRQRRSQRQPKSYPSNQESRNLQESGRLPVASSFVNKPSQIGQDLPGSASTETTMGSSQHSGPSVNPRSIHTDEFSKEVRSHYGRTSPERVVSQPNSGHSEVMRTIESFDICPRKCGGPPKLKAPLHLKNKERRNESKKSSEHKQLRPGMVLLKNYISNRDQIEITKTCRNLGLGPGGFYQPGYNDGAKLRLQMMCLGKNWDPQTREYVEHRSIDDAAAPVIPEDFKILVEKAIRDSHTLIKQEHKANNAERILPWMKPDICIVNFYTETGKLGLHQDRDESKESLSQRLPVVSFSIGDSAEFLYGDSRDADEADKVVLESGDVLIFGGEARHVFHGVPSINRGTAPKFLHEEVNLRPGRLNLTFRQY